MDKITEFRNDYFFLSNFYDAPVLYKGYLFRNNESAFQSAKTEDFNMAFCSMNPSEAKALGRKVKLRPDWESIKEEVMYDIVYAKFSQNKDLREKLIATRDCELIEGNTWGDKTWGKVNGVGENKLGKILMIVRERLGG